MRDSSQSRFRRLLLSSTLIAAASAAAQPLWAQAFQGTPTVAGGGVTFDRSTPNVETITQTTPVAIVNWAPNDAATGGGAIDFLPAGATATFQAGGSTPPADFTIVNRILPADPSRQVALNGIVNSQVAGAAAPVPGGQIWFYSPGGILVGATGTFNVGSLLLTANDPDLTGGTPYGTDNLATFTAAPDSSAAVEVAPGASITTTPEGSYVALIAPRVVQSGSVRVNGQAAYVAGEQVSITFRNPGQMFDITVPVGSFVASGDPDPTTLRHDGTTTGPASTGAADAHAIYLVAAAKASPVQALLRVDGTFGFDTASSATVQNGSIILGAGYQGEPIPDMIAAPAVTITGRGSVTSPVDAAPGRGMAIIASGTDTLSFAGDVTVRSLTSQSVPGVQPANLAIDVRDGASLSFAGNVTLAADAFGFVEGTDLPVPSLGGTAAVTVAAGGTLSVGGNLGLSAFASGANANSDTPGGIGGAVTGGAVSIVSAGRVTIGSLAMSAFAIGGDAADPAATAGAGTGGTALVSVTGGTFSVAGNTDLIVGGTAGAGSAGVGRGGSAQLNLGGGTASFGAVSLDASGTGSTGDTGGSGQGGAVLATIAGTANLGSLTLSTLSFGGDGAVGGAGAGGAATADLAISGGSLNVSGATLLQATAFGGAGATGSGGSATGGAARAAVLAGTHSLGSGVTLSADALGGSGGVGSSGTGGDGGAATGGFVFLAANSASVTAGPGPFAMTAFATGGAGGAGSTGGAGGTGTGGTATVDAQNGAAALTFADLLIDLRGTGGRGADSTAGGAGGAGGSGTGGNATVAATGTVTAANLYLEATGTGGAGGTGGTGAVGGAGTGGSVSLRASGGALTATAATLAIRANALGGAGGSGTLAEGGAGGAASGGSATVSATGGTLTGGTSITSLGADARGGVGGVGVTDGGAGGVASGGTALAETQAGASASFADLSLDVSATGGNGVGSAGAGAGGAGGIGSAGSGTVRATGNLTTRDIYVGASGRGGAGGGGGAAAGVGPRTGGAGGLGSGGFAYVSANGGRLTVTGSQLVVQAEAYGGGGGAGGLAPDGTIRGAGGAGGDAIGGLGSDTSGFLAGAYVVAQGGTLDFTAAAGTSISAYGEGGDGGLGSDGGTGGIGSGGTAQLVSLGGVLRGDDAFVYAGGYGGYGGAGSNPAGGGTGGAGGDGFGGFVLASAERADSAVVTMNNLTFFADAFGGTGGAGGTGTTQGGAGGVGGSGTAGVTQVFTRQGSIAITTLNTGANQFAGGGSGGAGGAATAAGGIGGAGGDGGAAQGNIIVYNANGGSATFGATRLWSLVLGGAGGGGGAGSIAGTAGAGGIAAGGQARLNAGVSSLTGVAGSLTAGAVSIEFDVTGGTGSTNGTVERGAAEVFAQNGAATLASLSIASANQTPPQTDTIYADAAPLTIGGVLAARATGPTTVRTSNGGTITAAGVVIDAGSASIVQTGNAPADGGPGLRTGTLTARVQGPFSASANILSAGQFSVVAGSDINLAGVTSPAGDIVLRAGGAIRTAALTAGDSILLTAEDGSVATGNLTAGIVASGTEYLGGIGIDAATGVTVGNLSARSLVGVAARAGGVSAGSITAGDDVLLLAGSTIGAGAITARAQAGTVDTDGNGPAVLLAGSGALAPGAAFDIGDRTILLSLLGTVTRTSGSITAGAIAGTGSLTAAAGTTLTLGALAEASSVSLAAGGDLRLGGYQAGSGDRTLRIDSSGAVSIAGPIAAASAVDVIAQGGIGYGTITAATGPVRLAANGTISGGAIDAGSIALSAGGFVSVGALAANGPASSNGNLNVLTRGSISLASAVSSDSIGLYAVTGGINATSLVAPDYLIALSGGGIQVGTLDSGAPYLGGIATASNPAFASSAARDPGAITDFRTTSPALFQVPQASGAGASALYAIAPVAAADSIDVGSLLRPNLVAKSAVSIDVNAVGLFTPLLVEAPTVGLTVVGDFTAPAGLIATSGLSVSASGAITTGALTLTDYLNLSGSGDVTTGAIRLSPPAQSTFAGSVFLESTRGSVIVNGDVRDADLSVYAQREVRFGNVLTDLDAELNIYANGAVAGGDVRAAEIEIGSLDSVTLGNVATNDAADASASHLDGLAVLGRGNVTLASATSRNRAELYSVDGSIDVGAVSAGELVVALASGGIRLGTVASRGPVYLAGFGTTRTGATDSRGEPVFNDLGDYSALSLADESDVNLLNLSGGDAGPNGGDILTVRPVAAAGAITVAAIQASDIVAASASRVALSAPEDMAVRAISAPAVALSAGGLLTIRGPVTGMALSLVSADIAVGSGGSAGGAGTERIDLVARAGSVLVGGAGSAGAGYVLDGREAEVIAGREIALVAPGTGGALPTVTLDTLAIEGSLIEGGVRSVTVSTPGTINVVGRVDMTGAAPTDRLALSAGETLRVTTPGAGIRLSNSGALAGELAIDAGRILVASKAAETDLATAATIAARAARLTQNDGPVDAAGYLQANRIALTAARAIHVQNSGTSALGAGLTAGAGGLTITSTAGETNTPLEVILYGRQQTATGFVTGGALIPATRIVGTTATGSAINGCLIADGAACGVVPQPPQPPVNPGPTPIAPPVEVPAAIASVADVVNGIVQAAAASSSSSSSTKSSLNAPNITTSTLLDFAPLTTFTDIETPVTSIGNEDVWIDMYERRRRQSEVPEVAAPGL